MGLRARFFTAQTARAILSWRLPVGAGVAVATAIVGLPVLGAVGVGVGAYAVLVGASMPRPPRRPAIDPFTVGEPWRQLVQAAQGSHRRLRDTVAGTAPGPLGDRLRAIADQLDRALDEAWSVARRGDEIDAAVRRLDPTGLRSRLGTLQRRQAEQPSPDTEAAIRSLVGQLDSAERLRRRSEQTAAELRLTQVKLDELVARANEIRVGTTEADSYARDVDDLVIQLEALHLAVEDVRTS